ncbi:energy transducer TonB [Erythrobacter sp. THAF29]|uniref:energy transducer TonB n=1 Tax=Erythrobacter sp. THAF29 TaxID=2587851 RepID=UPI0012694872|nr:energy transducer TonB [Erythrobacter sp. THAF29]QFT76285.1 Gram-negative bacterial tonB protein [Erythrobacter sp. THAF29]
MSLRQGARILTLKTGTMGDAFSVLNQCAEQLMVSWGLDLAEQKAQTRQPKLENWRKINERLFANWPSDMIEEAWRGSVNICVLVDERGRTNGCQATNMAMTQEMQEATCNSMTRARFDPARDAEGKPMRSFYEMTITYRVM